MCKVANVVFTEGIIELAASNLMVSKKEGKNLKNLFSINLEHRNTQNKLVFIFMGFLVLIDNSQEEKTHQDIKNSILKLFCFTV